MPKSERLGSRVTQLAWALLAVGVGAGAVCLIGGIGRAGALERAYLQAVTYFLGLSLGSLSLLMVAHLVRGAWGELCRRVWEAAAALSPLFVILLAPVFVDLSTIYPWADPAAVNEMEPRFAAKVEEKEGYFASWFFWLRAAGVLAAVTALSWLLVRWSTLEDRSRELTWQRRMRVLSGPGLFVLTVVLTFAATDWWKSLDPAWYSTMYPVLFLVGFAVGALALAILVVVLLGRKEMPLAHYLTPLRYGHLGTMLLALLMLWLYVNFGQYLITWSGDLPDKIQWFIPRARTSWKWVAAALLLLHFAVPFLILLPKANRRNPGLLAALAIGVLLLRAVDLHWLLAPSFHPEGASLHWLDIAAFVAVGGLWAALFVWRLSAYPVLPRVRYVLEEREP